MNKPYFLIIGESHPVGILTWLLYNGKLKNDDEAKKNFDKIENIIKKESEKLNDKKITKLFIEAPASKGRRRIYQEYENRHNLKKLESELFREYEKEFKQVLEATKHFYSTVKMTGKTHEFLNAVLDSMYLKRAQIPFIFSKERAGFNAKIFDINPVDNEQYFYDSGVIDIITYLLYVTYRGDESEQFIMRSLLRVLGIDEDELENLAKLAEDRLYSFIKPREESMYWNIINETRHKEIGSHYAPRYALICGEKHVKPLKNKLQENFEVDTQIIESGFEDLEKPT